MRLALPAPLFQLFFLLRTDDALTFVPQLCPAAFGTPSRAFSLESVGDATEVAASGRIPVTERPIGSIRGGVRILCAVIGYGVETVVLLLVLL